MWSAMGMRGSEAALEELRPVYMCVEPLTQFNLALLSQV